MGQEHERAEDNTQNDAGGNGSESNGQTEQTI